jgi:AcrR family transcriptional regulator
MVRLVRILGAVTSGRPYHHGGLDRAAVEGAVAEVEAVGVAGVSMRRIARRAGVSHAALAYQFGDKTGIFTAVAAEGFRLAAEAIGPAAVGADGFLRGGEAYVAFAIAHPGYFEVMFRPALYRADDPAVLSAKTAAFDILFGSARASLEAQGPATENDVRALVTAGWSLAHGFATLALTTNVGTPSSGPDDTAGHLRRGMIILGQLADQSSASS